MKNDSVSIGYLGPKGTFSEYAVLKFTNGKDKYKLKDYPTIPHVLRAAEKGELVLGIVPVENSIEGTVNITLDMLAHEVNLYIQGELILDIRHCLVTKSKEAKDIHTIYSHPQALAQCRRFLYKNFPHACYLNSNSTAEAALLVKNGEVGLAAISSMEAAKKSCLDILYKDVSDYEKNQTRFLIVGKEQCSFSKPNKTSLCLALARNRPGGLYEILEEFKKERINLTKIESRPAKKELGSYLFFIDCSADLLEDKAHVLKKLKEKCIFLKILGCYFEGSLGDNL